MKITDIKATPINMPIKVPFHWAGGLHSGTSKVIVEVETDVGIVGFGEAHSTDCLHHIQEMTDEPSQSLFRYQYLDVIEGSPFRQTHNVLRVPEGSDLGVTWTARHCSACTKTLWRMDPWTTSKTRLPPAASNACP